MGLCNGRESASMKRSPGKKRTASDRAAVDEIPDYDFSRASSNKYASRFAAGSLVVVLEPDVAAAFLTSRDANEVLRALAGIKRKRRVRRSPRRAML